MFGGRRLAKRSIVGTKISALGQDGRYFPGVIQAQSSDEGFVTNAMYSVRFDDGYIKDVSSKDIVGSGFQPVTALTLKNGQKVFITMNGREVSGLVITQDEDNVLISVGQSTDEVTEILRKTDEVRLLQSRKSARLVDQDTDYSKLADVHLSEPKKRAVSHVIDVPAKTPRQRIYHSSCEPDELDDVEMVDEKIAALALTSLSCSPASPTFPGSFKDKDFLAGPHSYQEGHLSSSAASSGFGSGHSERSDRSPPLPFHLSESAPASIGTTIRLQQDDGLDLEEDVKKFYDDSQTYKNGVKTVYKCTWRKCGKMATTSKRMAKHVKTAHLGRESDSDSEGETEFYYNEIEVAIDSVTERFAELHTSSPSTTNHVDSPGSFGIFDHDYQRKEHRNNSHALASSVPGSGIFLQQGASIPITIPEGQIKRSLSWQISPSSPGVSTSSPIRMSRPTAQERLHQHQAQSPKSHMLSSPPKATGIHRKPRSDVRKCRKVYGMEHKEQWCTQCKWKKACTRFLD